VVKLSPRLRALEYAVVDVETTGGSASMGHRITEVCAVCLDGAGNRVEEFRTLVNPLRPIPPSVTRLTNITDSMVRDAPRFGEIVDDLHRVLDGRVFVAHNAGFDWRFVTVEMETTRGRRPPSPHTLCTVRMARRLVPEIRSRSLDALSWFFGIDNEARHRAWGDARATAQIFRRLLDRLEEHEIHELAELESFLKPKKKKRKKRTALPTSMEYPESI